MKKHWKTLIFTGMTAAVLSCGMPAFAVSDVHATLYTDSVYVEGREVYCWNPDAKQTNYVSYNGTIYAPIRTVGEWMGKTVSWDEASKSILLNGTVEKVYREEAEGEIDAETLAKRRDDGMTVELRDDIKVVVDGKEQTFKNSKGETIYPINYNNMNYLPVRSIGELLGMSVKYLPKTDDSYSSVFLRTPLTDAQVQEGLKYVKTLETLESYKNPDYKLPTSLTAKFDELYHEAGKKGTHASDSMFLSFKSYWDKATLDECKAFTTAARSAIQKMIDTPCPDFALLKNSHEKMVEAAKKSLAEFQKVQESIDSGSDADTIAKMLGHDSSEDSMSACSSTDYIGAQIGKMYVILSENYLKHE